TICICFSASSFSFSRSMASSMPARWLAHAFLSCCHSTRLTPSRVGRGLSHARQRIGTRMKSLSHLDVCMLFLNRVKPRERNDKIRHRQTVKPQLPPPPDGERTEE